MDRRALFDPHPRVQITQEKLCDDGTIQKTCFTKAVLPDFLVPGRLYGTKTQLSFMTPFKVSEKSTEHEKMISSLTAIKDYERLVHCLSTSKGKERAACIRRHRQKFLQEIGLQNSLNISRQICCPHDCRLTPSFARKKKTAMLILSSLLTPGPVLMHSMFF